MKKFLFFILLALIVVLAISKNVTKILYFNPQTNVEVFSEVAPLTKLLNKNIENAISVTNEEGYKIKLLYANAYGSGFLAENTIPNDLDYSIGVDLGLFVYDGKNEKQITQKIFKEINSLQASLYYSFADDFYSPYSKIESLKFITREIKGEDEFANSIKKVIKSKDYVVYTKKELEDVRPVQYITFPFPLKSNEILIEDMPPISLYSNNVIYNDTQKKYPKEISLVVDYSFKLKDKESGKIFDIELVAESFKGQRMQLSRRFFVPQIFIGDSENYLNSLDYVKNNDKYFEYRKYNFERLLMEVGNLTLSDDRPVKKMKRILQIESLIEPALDKNSQKNIKEIISENLNNPQVQQLNDFTNIYGNLITIAQSPRLFFEMQRHGEIEKYIKLMNESIDALEKSNGIDKKALKD